MALKGTRVPIRLRERKKASTQALLRSTALRLFKERGFAAVSVDEIATEAEVSRSTFFRYFGSKEAVLFNEWDESGDVFLAELLDRPRNETPWQAFEEALVATSLDAADRMAPDEQRAVSDLLRHDPALSSRRLKELAHWTDRIAGVFAARAGRDRPEMDDRLAASTCMAVSEEVGRVWRDDPNGSAPDHIRKAFEVLRTF